ncbi:MAG: NADH dehydrogenase ubiquinone Fe-S protein 4 [Litorimonas sp.]
MFAKIYQPAPSAMTSGRAHSGQWILEFVSRAVKHIDPLTGNTSSSAMRDQLELTFSSAEEAVTYAKANDIPHRVIRSSKMKRIPRSYGDNFNYERKLPWTH